MMRGIDESFLDRLAADLPPVTPLGNRRVGLALVGLGLVGTILVSATLGPRADLMAGTPHPVFLFRWGTLLMLGLISATAVLAMARPGVGRAGRAWLAAVAMAAMVPLTALGLAVADPQGFVQAVWWSSAITCLLVSLLSASGFAAILVWHLRRGAPVAPARAATATGIAAGSLGVLTYTIHCPSNEIAYVGLWYGLAIALSTLACRLIVPRLIRW
jgi:hypothetical protein